MRFTLAHFWIQQNLGHANLGLGTSPTKLVNKRSQATVTCSTVSTLSIQLFGLSLAGIVLLSQYLLPTVLSRLDPSPTHLLAHENTFENTTFFFFFFPLAASLPLWLLLLVRPPTLSLGADRSEPTGPLLPLRVILRFFSVCPHPSVQQSHSRS